MPLAIIHTFEFADNPPTKVLSPEYCHAGVFGLVPNVKRRLSIVKKIILLICAPYDSKNLYLLITVLLFCRYVYIILLLLNFQMNW